MNSQEIRSSLVSFRMIFEALQSELFLRFKFQILEIPESDLDMIQNHTISSRIVILTSRK